MIISKIGSGEYDMHIIQSNFTWKVNPDPDNFVIVPESLQSAVAATNGFCTITYADGVLISLTPTEKHNADVPVPPVITISDNSGLIDIGEWDDENPDSENRIGYFVTAVKPSTRLLIDKARADSNVKGVTVALSAFIADAPPDVYGITGILPAIYDYVMVSGFAEIIDNGTCVVGECCMPADDGTASPSPNELGYPVVERTSADKVLIAVEPQTDAIQRLRMDMQQLHTAVHSLNS